MAQQIVWFTSRIGDAGDEVRERMLVNEYLSWRRKWSRIALHGDIELTESGPDHAAQHAERDAVRLQILRLPRQQQVVLALRYYGGLSDTEIADAMGCAAATVRGYDSRALATLRADARGQLIGIEGTTP